MSNAKRLPTLVTYRSAEAFRDAGIRYAYMRAGVLASFMIAMLAGSVVLRLMLKSPEQSDSLAWLLSGIAVAAGVAMVLYGRAVEYPQCPRMTLEELEAMRSDMGMPAHVFQQTHDSVLHGSMEEIHAQSKALDLIQRLMRSPSRMD